MKSKRGHSNKRLAYFDGGPFDGKASEVPKKGKCLQAKGGWYHKTGKKKFDRNFNPIYVFRWEPNK